MLFGQTIYQNIKVFRNNKYHTTLSNAFQVANTCRTGKYVVIVSVACLTVICLLQFESDTLYRKSPAAILNALQQMEHEYTTELDEEQRRKRAEKNSRKKAKRKEKKLLQQGLEEAEKYILAFDPFSTTRFSIFDVLEDKKELLLLFWHINSRKDLERVIQRTRASYGMIYLVNRNIDRNSRSHMI